MCKSKSKIAIVTDIDPDIEDGLPLAVLIQDVSNKPPIIHALTIEETINNTEYIYSHQTILLQHLSGYAPIMIVIIVIGLVIVGVYSIITQ
jgi:hypothetical protein